MALYMFFHVLPDSHIEYLNEHPDTFRSYMEGREPKIRKSLLDKLFGREIELALPHNWPQTELEGFCPEVNHRQVELFHYLLNEKIGSTIPAAYSRLGLPLGLIL